MRFILGHKNKCRISRHIPGITENALCSPPPPPARPILRINLPLGGDTHITIDEYKTLLDAVVEGGELSPTRKFFDENRMSNRWSGQKDLASREATQADLTRITQNNNWGHGWKDGPPVIGDGDGELSVNMAHVSGRIFAEDVFSMAEVEEGDEDNAEFFFSDATGEDEDARQ